MNKRISGILLLIGIFSLAFGVVYSFLVEKTLINYVFLGSISIYGICFFISMFIKYIKKNDDSKKKVRCNLDTSMPLLSEIIKICNVGDKTAVFNISTKKSYVFDNSTVDILNHMLE